MGRKRGAPPDGRAGHSQKGTPRWCHGADATNLGRRLSRQPQDQVVTISRVLAGRSQGRTDVGTPPTSSRGIQQNSVSCNFLLGFQAS
jgi:hypothetical protein